jgi:fumarate reductase subunit D
MWEFLAAHFWTVFGLITSFGAIGVVVLILVVGVPFLVIIENIVGAFKALVTFFTTPLGQAIGVVLLCVLCWFVSDIHATRREVAKCQAADVQAALDAANRDTSIAKATAARAAKDAGDLRQLNDTLNAKVNDYAKALAKRPAAQRCSLDKHDVERLRDIGRASAAHGGH